MNLYVANALLEEPVGARDITGAAMICAGVAFALLLAPPAEDTLDAEALLALIYSVPALVFVVTSVATISSVAWARERTSKRLARAVLEGKLDPQQYNRSAERSFRNLRRLNSEKSIDSTGENGLKGTGGGGRGKTLTFTKDTHGKDIRALSFLSGALTGCLNGL